MTTWALAGAGFMGSIHAVAIDALPGHRLVAVAGAGSGRAAALAAEVGARVVENDELPADADVVIVATPPDTHVRLALRAAAGGAATLIETPIASTLADADRLVRVADVGGVLAYGEGLLHAPTTDLALSTLAGLGRLDHLSARAVQPRPGHRPVDGRKWGGGALFDGGAHVLALMLRAARSEPSWVAARFDADPVHHVESRAELEIGFASGLTATMTTAWADDTPIWDIQGASEIGAVRYELLPDIALERNGDPVPIPDPAAGDHPPQLDRFGYLDQLRDLALAAASGTRPTIATVGLGRDVLEVICAAAVSAREGRRQPLPYTGPRNRTPAQLWLGEA